jgi:DNA-binding transcriptional MerR regulator
MTMMTTTKTSLEIELTGTEQLELHLGDLHVEELALAPDILNNPLVIAAPLSLPAALCDDKLLAEINSIPDKMGFKIGDVADILGIKQYVLRYWETEFDLLKPKKASNNQRMYTRKDVENAFLIRKLLHRDRFSIEGARNALKELKAHVKKEKDYSQVVHRLDSVHDRLEDLVIDIRKVRQLFK